MRYIFPSGGGGVGFGLGLELGGAAVPQAKIELLLNLTEIIR